jgi:hypothetical protein
MADLTQKDPISKSIYMNMNINMYKVTCTILCTYININVEHLPAASLQSQAFSIKLI